MFSVILEILYFCNISVNGVNNDLLLIIIIIKSQITLFAQKQALLVTTAQSLAN